MSNIPAVVVDASFMVALCAREAGRFERAEALLADELELGAELYAPGVLVAEVLFALCRNLANGEATPGQYEAALRGFEAYFPAILPPPSGDPALALRAAAIRGDYGCSHSADGLYLALTELLAETTRATLVTFDAGLKRHANTTVPTLHVRLLPS